MVRTGFKGDIRSGTEDRVTTLLGIAQRHDLCMGATDLLGVPAWVSQRLWFGTILLAAGMGMLYLLRTLRVRGRFMRLYGKDVQSGAMLFTPSRVLRP